MILHQLSSMDVKVLVNSWCLLRFWGGCWYPDRGRSTRSSPNTRIIHTTTQEHVSVSVNNDSPETKRCAHSHSAAVRNFVTSKLQPPETTAAIPPVNSTSTPRPWLQLRHHLHFKRNGNGVHLSTAQWMRYRNIRKKTKLVTTSKRTLAG